MKTLVTDGFADDEPERPVIPSTYYTTSIYTYPHGTSLVWTYRVDVMGGTPWPTSATGTGSTTTRTGFNAGI